MLSTALGSSEAEREGIALGDVVPCAEGVDVGIEDDVGETVTGGKVDGFNAIVGDGEISMAGEPLGTVPPTEGDKEVMNDAIGESDVLGPAGGSVDI